MNRRDLGTQEQSYKIWELVYKTGTGIVNKNNNKHTTFYQKKIRGLYRSCTQNIYGYDKNDYINIKFLVIKIIEKSEKVILNNNTYGQGVRLANPWECTYEQPINIGKSIQFYC